MKCKVCGRKYHCCSNCDTSGQEYLTDGYCSETCYQTLPLAERLRDSWCDLCDRAADEIDKLRLERDVLALNMNENSRIMVVTDGENVQSIHWSSETSVVLPKWYIVNRSNESE